MKNTEETSKQERTIFIYLDKKILHELRQFSLRLTLFFCGHYYPCDNKIHSSH